MKNKNDHDLKKAKTANWRWWSGGGVVAVAVALGCATAIDFKSSGREAGHKRELAAEPQQDLPHNGGKVRMPISVSFDGEPSISISSDSNVQILFLADADIQSIQGSIEGIDGLAGEVNAPLGFSDIAAGETRAISVSVPAKSGRLVIRISGLVVGSGESRQMSTALELRVVNPREVRAAREIRKSSRDMTEDPVMDSQGQLIQPMKSK